jgi:uroporphyrinogen decarboxylase
MENQSIKKVLEGTRLKRPPCWFMRQAGRYLPEYKQTRSKFSYFKDFLFSVPDVVEVTLQPLNRFNLYAAIIFSDILVVPMILGADVDVVENLGPQLSVIENPEGMKNLNTRGNFEKCQPIYEAISEVRSKLDKDKSLIGFAGGPWTVASYMLEGQTSKTFGKIKTFAYKWPLEFKSLLDIISDITATHLINQIRSGADIVKIFDSWAGAIPHEKINDWVIEPHRRVVEKVKEVFPSTNIISFLKGQERSYNEYLKKVPVNGLALGTNTDLNWAAESISGNIALQGALDPYLLVIGGQQMIDEIEVQYEILGKRPYIFNLGHGIVPETPFKNVQIVLDTLDRIAR